MEEARNNNINIQKIINNTNMIIAKQNHFDLNTIN